MDYLLPISLFLFVCGLFFGSFFLVVIDRLQIGKSSLTGRSVCTHCGHVLGPHDLIPLLSFFLLRGKCRYCHKRLSWNYPVFELGTAILFGITPFLLTTQYFVGFSDIFGFVLLIYTLYVVSALLLIAAIDIRMGIIPFVIVLPAALISIIYRVILSPETLVSSILSALAAGGLFLLIHLLTRGRGMGFGDVVLAAYLGLLLGFPAIIPGLYIAFLTGAGVSLILIMSGRKKMKGSTIPFGPFLVFGAYISYFWGVWLFETLFQLLLLN